MTVAEQMRLEYLEKLEGQTVQVVFEEAEGDRFTGHTPNYVKVYVPAEALHNQILPVRLLQPSRDGMLGEIGEENA